MSSPQPIYLAFGAKTYHQEACFSIISALAQLKKTGNEPLDIQVHTDDPTPYAKLPVTVHLIDDATRAALADVAMANDRLPRPPTLHRLGYKVLSLTLPSHQRQGRLDSEQLCHLLHQPGLRLSLGRKFKDVKNHLLHPAKG